MSNVAPVLTAQPDPVPWSATPGTVSVTWRSEDGTPLEVRVARNGTEETLFAVGAEGTKIADWIAPGSTYEFRLYRSGEMGVPIATATVRMAPPPVATATVPMASPPIATAVVPVGPPPVATATVPMARPPVSADQPRARRPYLAADPNPLPADSATRHTRLSWDTGDGSHGVVTVVVRGAQPGQEAPFASGRSGSHQIGWIRPDNVYQFRLYRGDARDRPIARTNVMVESPKGEFIADVVILLTVVFFPVALALTAFAVVRHLARSAAGRLRRSS